MNGIFSELKVRSLSGPLHDLLLDPIKVRVHNYIPGVLSGHGAFRALSIFSLYSVISGIRVSSSLTAA